MSEEQKNDRNAGLREVNMTCRRNSDPRSFGSCDSMRAVIVSDTRGIPNTQGVTQYRCVKCNYTWTVAVGGSFNL